MAGGIERLSDVQIRAFIRRMRDGTAPKKKLADGGGLYLTVTKTGSPVWRLKYRLVGKERVYSVGLYPDVGLAEARLARAEARKLIAQGMDPVGKRRELRAANAVASTDSFKASAEAWLAKRKQHWSPVHHATSKRALERDVFPLIGNLPITGITTPMYANVIERIVRRGSNETARKVLFNVRRIVALASTRDPTVDRHVADPVSEVLVQVKPYTPRRALLEFAALGDVLRRAERANLSPNVRMAHRLVAFTAQRLGNIVEARWEQLDLDGAEPMWRIGRAEMKIRNGRSFDHKVLLGPTIVADLKAWRAVSRNRGFVFPSLTKDDDHITREALDKAYRTTLGLEKLHSVHGWRASLSTLAKDHGFSADCVELLLDHVSDNQVARAYDRGERLLERRRLMDWWDANLTAAQRPGDPPTSDH